MPVWGKWNNNKEINFKKFKFVQRETNFIDYNIDSCQSYRPTDDMLSAIKNFPMTSEPSIKDIR